jgi:hypothetical protein
MSDLSRRDLLRISAAGAAGAAATGWVAAAPADAARRRPFVPYGRRSYFRRPLTDPRIDWARTRAFRRFMATHPDQRDFDHPRLNGLDGNPWGTPYALGKARHPIWRLTGDLHPKVRRLERRGFHAPGWLGEMLTGTSDSPLCVVDVASGFTLFCNNAERVGRRLIRAENVGITFHGTNGLDHRHRRANDRRNFTSRGRISDAMVIREDLVRHGIEHDTDLGHVLHMFFVETRSRDGHTGPMINEEDDNFGWGAQGERIAIAPSVNLRRRKLSPSALVIARTLQNHGCYLGDNSGSQSAFKMQQENDVRRVWRGHRLHRDSLRALSWDDFVVIR